MGIPSYYKKLITNNPGLVTNNHPNETIDWLFMDFNCLIYHCLHKEDTPIYPGNEHKEEWEKQFISCIVQYCLKIIKQIHPTKGVYIAIDGVVPMAKMKQQRLRRFKSSWLSKHTNDSSKPKWDTNSITPGTNFMKILHHALLKMIRESGKKWILSTSDEPGEGEHKIISQWRTNKYNGNFAIYGLDADLIVLSILGKETCSINKIWLFREEQEAGKTKYNILHEEIYEWFSIDILYEWLTLSYSSENKKQFILMYCFSMSFLGNDFLPTSLSLKIRDNGHSHLLSILNNLMTQQHYIIEPDTYNISFDNILSLFSMLANTEPLSIRNYISKKIASSRNIEKSDKIDDNNIPLFHIEEKVLVDSKNNLLQNWKDKYLSFFSGYSSNDIPLLCEQYLYGIQWIWSYYLGQYDKVCFNWMYSHSIPPLWEWLYLYLKSNCLPNFPNKIELTANDITPLEQLSLVLPLDSWSLISSCSERKFPIYAPQYYPDSFLFDTFGKRFFWECESIIPIPTILEIKNIIKFNTSSYS
jgi:5'-3' exonuclease